MVIKCGRSFVVSKHDPTYLPIGLHFKFDAIAHKSTYSAGACNGACIQFLLFYATVEAHRALEFAFAAKLSAGAST
jgi:hypothetical protein